MTVAHGAYFFAAAWALALLEIQIEGPAGWASALPTWRWAPRFLKRPVTGYHVYLLTFILLLLHLPQLYMGFSWAREAELLSLFFLLAVGWDFLWFAHNPHFGLARFRPEHVWWFGPWWLRVPCDYWIGTGLSAAVYILPAADRAAAAGRWAGVAGVFAGLIVLSLAARPRPVLTKP